MKTTPGKRIVAQFLVLAILGTSIAGPANAALVSTEQVASAASEGVPAERERIQTWLAREDVTREMQNYGVSAADAQQRVAALSDEEARELAGNIDTLPAGGSVIGVLFTVFIVLLITDILGFTKVFPFTRSVR